MAFKKVNECFSFSKEQQKGIFLLFCIIVGLQLVYFFVDFNTPSIKEPDKQKWLAMESEIDSMKMSHKNEVTKIYPFNPNFITDYKGYKLGMSVAEIDRLLAFRKENKYVNSADEFQKITLISDSLLKVIAPYFKFPDWVKNKSKQIDVSKSESFEGFNQKKIVFKDINQATQEDLINIYGIGDVISIRILKFKEDLGGFVSMEQMKDVWGLSPEVVESLNSHFKIFALPDLKKIDINNASLKELSRFPYFKYALAKEIVTYRSMNGEIKNAADLTKIKGLPIEKANIIALYLAF